MTSPETVGLGMALMAIGALVASVCLPLALERDPYGRRNRKLLAAGTILGAACLASGAWLLG